MRMKIERLLVNDDKDDDNDDNGRTEMADEEDSHRNQEGSTVVAALQVNNQLQVKAGNDAAQIFVDGQMVVDSHNNTKAVVVVAVEADDDADGDSAADTDAGSPWTRARDFGFRPTCTKQTLRPPGFPRLPWRRKRFCVSCSSRFLKHARTALVSVPQRGAVLVDNFRHVEG